MSAFDASVLALGALGAAAAVLLLRQYVPRMTPGTAPRPDDEAPAVEESETVVFPSNDTTGGRYLDDPARAGWEVPPAARESAIDPRSSSVPPTAVGPVTVPPEAVAAARDSLDAGDAERAVERAYHAVREELASRADLDAHRTPAEFRDACRAAFESRDLDAVESLVGLYERVVGGSMVSRGVVEAVLDRVTGRGERLDRNE